MATQFPLARGTCRWLVGFSSYMQEYNFTVEHRSGLLHSNADALSLRPCYSLPCMLTL